MFLLLQRKMPRPRNQGLRGNWDAESLQNAIIDTQNGMSVNMASNTYGIPRRTLREYLQKGNMAKSPMGRKTIISLEQEEELCKRIIRLSEVGYPLTAKVLRRCVYNFCVTNYQ